MQGNHGAPQQPDPQCPLPQEVAVLCEDMVQPACAQAAPEKGWVLSAVAMQPQSLLLKPAHCSLPAARAEKAKATFPRPAAGVLKPVVRGQTIKYNSKQRLGRGFTLAELKVQHGVGSRHSHAACMGISSDIANRAACTSPSAVQAKLLTIV